MDPDSAEVKAAGGVVWRRGPAASRSRSRTGRTARTGRCPRASSTRASRWEQAALREVQEEIGFRCRLGRELPPPSYTDQKGRSKVVRYWLMEPEEGEFDAQRRGRRAALADPLRRPPSCSATRTTASSCAEPRVNRDRFPGLADGWARLDGPGGTQMVDVAIDAMTDWMRSGRTANEGGAFPHARRVRRDRRAARAPRSRAMLGADAPGRVRAEHDGAHDGLLGRRRPRAPARRRDRLHAPGPRRQRAPVADRGRARGRPRALRRARAGARSSCPPARSRRCCRDRTRWVAVTAASNAVGTVPTCRGSSPPRAASARASTSTRSTPSPHRPHESPSSTSTRWPARPTSGSARTSACCAPRPELLAELTPDKLRPSSDGVPERWELGTLPFESLAGVRAAAEYVPRARWEEVRAHEDALLETRARRPARDRRRDALRRRARPHPDADVQRRGHDRARGRRRARRARDRRLGRQLLRVGARAPPRARARTARSARASCTTTTPPTPNGCSPRSPSWPRRFSGSRGAPGARARRRRATARSRRGCGARGTRGRPCTGRRRTGRRRCGRPDAT